MTVRTSAQTSSLTTIALLTRAMFLEALRRREFYGLLLFMGLYFIGAVIIRIVGVEDAATAAFVMNLGLTLAFFMGQLMTLLAATRVIPEEMETRTIFPTLAKPLSRAEFVLGKWFASFLAGIFTTAVLTVLAWLPAQPPPDLHAGAFVQALVLQMSALALLSSLGVLLSLVLPKAVNILLLVILITAGPRITAAVRGQLSENILGKTLDWALRYVPDVSLLNFVDRFTDGLPPLSGSDLFLRLLYAGVSTVFFVVLASTIFYRRVL